MTNLRTSIQELSKLDEDVKKSMYALYSKYYDSTSESSFLNDLLDKNYAILLLNHEEQLKGFSTLAILTQEHDGTIFRAIFSGDTIIHHDHWGQQALAFPWIRLAGRIKAQQPHIPLFWFLIVKGHRTYRYLSAFSHQYYPAWSHPTPPEVQALMDRMATTRFGEYYDPLSGLLRFPHSYGHLSHNWAIVPEEDRRRPEVQFFLERNPGYTHGHELVCLTELHEGNLRPLARRLFLQGMNS